jgi:hypothetical protein
MAHRTKESVFSHVQSELKELQAKGGLPFRDLLDEERILAALNRAGIEFRERVFTPMVTLWAFLSQAASGTASSCQNAVSRVLADRAARKQKACSADNSSYCQARCRLPENVIIDLAQETGRELHQRAPWEWLWKGRRVIIVDGSTATMADTAQNQKEYPQSKGQKPGLGFPILRFVVLLSLATGTVLECAIGACRGKNTGEQSLFRQSWDALQAGEIVLGDRLYDAYRDMALLKQRGVDTVFGMKQSRHCDFRTGRQLGREDHIVTWKRPNYDASRYTSREDWELLPEEMEIREIRITVRRKGYRLRKVTVVTTLLDHETYSSQDVMELFAERWNCELDLRLIKQALGMHHLECKTPEMVRKELWAHLLAYNLIRVRMAQAAATHGVLPRKLSFTAAMNHISNFSTYMSAACPAERDRLERALLTAIATCCVGDRPGRKEPRAVKKRKQKYSYLMKPRIQARKALKA